MTFELSGPTLTINNAAARWDHVIVLKRSREGVRMICSPPVEVLQKCKKNKHVTNEFQTNIKFALKFEKFLFISELHLHTTELLTQN